MYNGQASDSSQATLTRLGKRVPNMDETQDLRTLADMYRGRNVDNAEATLMRLGKQTSGKVRQVDELNKRKQTLAVYDF